MSRVVGVASVTLLLWSVSHDSCRRPGKVDVVAALHAASIEMSVRRSSVSRDVSARFQSTLRESLNVCASRSLCL